MGNDFDKIMGRLKEAIGGLTGNRKLKNEGKVDQASARVKDKTDHAVNKVKDAFHDD